MLDETEPDIVISLGLWPGEGDIRFERIALNIMDFGLAHNNGESLLHQPICSEGATPVTIQVRAIELAIATRRNHA